MNVYENDHILMYEYDNGTMTIDKNTGMMISWEGKGCYEESEKECRI